jgi:ATP-dependent helicase/nuclease subunit A
MSPLPQDQGARDRIVADLDANLLVEAGAGSGKTRALVGRMLALVERGTPVEQLAAVTFTRKAAAELRERFEEALERRAGATSDAENALRLREARDHLGRAFLGTIHAFAARLLREHPLEAGLDPVFAEVSEEEWPAIRGEFWRNWMERCRTDADPALDALRQLNVDPRNLFEAFQERSRFPDVTFPVHDAPKPDAGACRAALERLMDRARQLMPNHKPDAGWDKAQAYFLRLERLRRSGPDWQNVARFCDALSDKGNLDFTMVRWNITARRSRNLAPRDLSPVHVLEEDLREFQQNHALPLLRAWRAHRYAPVMRFLDRAVQAFAVQRHARGTLGFEDLLQLAARLLREAPDARRRLGERYRHLLVDEFQDTDPIQAEVCFLLASEPGQGNNWTTVTPRPGALFVVGDPKQSIYRFRRADITTYELVKQCISRTGAVLQLTHNFRSVEPIAELVNRHFPDAFPASASAIQAAFAPLITSDTGEPADGVFRYPVRPESNNKPEIVSACAAQVATMIDRRLARGYRRADFLVLTTGKAALSSYANELAARNIPVNVTGAGLTSGYELQELLVLLRAIADPTNKVLVVAALEGLFAGLAPDDLLAAHRDGATWDLTAAPAGTSSPAGAALARLHGWWQLSQQLPADLLLERIVDDTGLLPHTASGTLGDNAAGAIAEVIAVARQAVVDGAGSLGDVMLRIEAAVASAESEASLRPGLEDAVRVMNLHKAKGLQARVVILAAPIAMWKPAPTVHVDRQADGSASGAMSVIDDDCIIAQPANWDELCAREVSFLDAEFDRLLYVATTRAKRELWVAQLDFDLKDRKADDKSLWARLAPALEVLAGAEELPTDAPPGRRKVERTAAEIGTDAEATKRRRAEAASPRWSRNTVTRLAREEAAEAEELKLVATRGPGRTWGTAVHECIEAMGRGRSGANLARYVRAVARKHELSEPDGSRLLELVRAHAASPEWAGLMAAGETMQVELQVASMETGENGVPQLIEGVIDAVAKIDGAWSIMDWKTDGAEDAAWQQREEQYQGQVNRYVRILSKYADGPVTGHVVRLRAELP